MNKHQYYLSKLAEEASELAQVALKCMQFGLEEVNPNTLEKNYEALQKEFTDVLACAVLVEEFAQEQFTTKPEQELIEAKWDKVERYRKISIGNGMSYDG